MVSTRQYRIAVIRWETFERLPDVICDEIANLGHIPSLFFSGSAIPQDAEIVFSFAPYGTFLQVPYQLARIPPDRRPTFVHWNTEGIPDPRLPWSLIRLGGELRSWLERQFMLSNHYCPIPGQSLYRRYFAKRVLRFRYVGDYHYAYRHGWLPVLADSSAIYARLRSQNGLPTLYAPWGSTARWYADLKCTRDIDVLWMGERATRRRAHLLESVCEALDKRGVRIYLADNQKNPFIFDAERTSFLNRAKITLNLTRTWYDDNYSRFSLAAPNRSLIVSEPLLPHCPEVEVGKHYVSAPVKSLAQTILYYLEHENERQSIVENAYELYTTQLTLRRTVEQIVNSAIHVRQRTLENA